MPYESNRILSALAQARLLSIHDLWKACEPHYNGDVKRFSEEVLLLHQVGLISRGQTGGIVCYSVARANEPIRSQSSLSSSEEEGET